jgi:hypothetical protein
MPVCAGAYAATHNPARLPQGGGFPNDIVPASNDQPLLTNAKFSACPEGPTACHVGVVDRNCPISVGHGRLLILGPPLLSAEAVYRHAVRSDQSRSPWVKKEDAKVKAVRGLCVVGGRLGDHRRARGRRFATPCTFELAHASGACYSPQRERRRALRMPHSSALAIPSRMAASRA